VERWQGAEATRSRLLKVAREGGLRQFVALHFATHGVVGDANSALVLAREGASPFTLLTDTDLATLKLDSELVILSACDSGLGARRAGEGMLGLPYALALAGNRNTLMTLWPIDDEGAVAFVDTFVAHVTAGRSVHEALVKTRQEMRNGAGGVRARSPAVWGAFVLYGG
jgi:CHAT domain-containing protein